MKKLTVFLVLIMSVSMLHAQHKLNSFFDANGLVRLETTEMQNDSISTVFHRAEDIAWYRVVYSVIDMRFKQNIELYYPVRYTQNGKSLFGVMMQAIMGGAPVYEKPYYTSLKPHFDVAPVEAKSLPAMLELKDEVGNDADAFTASDLEELADVDFTPSNNRSVLKYDSVSGKLSVDEYYDQFVTGQIKFMIQEVVFFDSRYSRLYRQVVAIAPMYSPNAEGVQDPYEALYQEILFWMPFRNIRPYLKTQYVLSNGNSGKRITFDQFFAQRLYNSYIVGDDNVYDRVVPEYVRTQDMVKSEQQRIENELLDFEQNLWEY